MTSLRYLDATADPDDRVDYPDVVREFVTLGFEQIGRIRAVQSEGTFEDLAAEYAPHHQADFLAHATVPTPVLRSPDHVTVAEVSWFWGAPSVRLRSVLVDGALVETYRRWDHEPALPVALSQIWRTTDIDREMTKAAVPERGRSIEVATGSAASLWEHHRGHLHRSAELRRAEPAPCGGLAGHLATIQRAFAHEEAVQARTTSLWRRLIAAYGVLAVLCIVALILAGWPVLLASPIPILLFPSATGLIISRLRVLPRRLRPAYV